MYSWCGQTVNILRLIMGKSWVLSSTKRPLFSVDLKTTGVKTVLFHNFVQRLYQSISPPKFLILYLGRTLFLPSFHSTYKQPQPNKNQER